MRAKHVYLLLCVAGTVLPYAALLPFLRAHGPDVGRFAREALANAVSTSFVLDVLVSSAALWVLALVDGRRAGVRPLWAPLAGNLAAGLSLGLPLYLYLRERARERGAAAD